MYSSSAMTAVSPFDNDNDNDNDVLTMTMTMTMMFLFSHVTQYKGIEENQGFSNSKNTNEQINIA